jgi:hypothetical protein
LGPFLSLNYKDFGRIYQLKNKSVYQGLLQVFLLLFRINYSMGREDLFCMMELLYNLSFKMVNQQTEQGSSRLMVIIFQETCRKMENYLQE